MTLRHIRIFLAVCEKRQQHHRRGAGAVPGAAGRVAPWPSWRNITVCACSTVSVAACISPRPGGACGNTRCTSAACSTTWKGPARLGRTGRAARRASITIGSQFLPGYVDAFRAAHPGVDVRVWVGPSEQLEEKLLHNTLDVALMEGPVHGSALTAEEYMADTLAVVCAPAVPLRRARPCRWTPSASSAFCCAKKGSGTREQFDSGPRPRVSRSRRYGNPPARWRW